MNFEQLRKAHQLWDPGKVWTTVATGPDYCTYLATREGTTLRAGSVRGLDELISAVEKANGWSYTLGGRQVPNL